MNLLEQLDIKNRATARSRYITPLCMRVCEHTIKDRQKQV